MTKFWKSKRKRDHRDLNLLLYIFFRDSSYLLIILINTNILNIYLFIAVGIINRVSCKKKTMKIETSFQSRLFLRIEARNQISLD